MLLNSTDGEKRLQEEHAESSVVRCSYSIRTSAGIERYQDRAMPRVSSKIAIAATAAMSLHTAVTVEDSHFDSF